MVKETIWHNLTAEQALHELKTSAQGLNQAQIEKRRQTHGANILPTEDKFSDWKILFAQFKSPLIYILFAAGLITLFLREWTDTVVIFSAVMVNTAIGYWQERKASQALSKLKTLVEPKCFVWRDGQEKQISTKDLVPGDIMALKAGDRIGADARLLEAQDLKVSEAALTGEWLANKKEIRVLDKGVVLADRTNMVYMGTLVEEGLAKAIVVAVGEKTQIGQIAGLVKQENEKPTPFQNKVAKLTKAVGLAVAIIALFIFIDGLISGEDSIIMFTTAVAVAVAAIPEGLPVAFTVVLAIGMQRILKKKGLVRRLLSAETLGSTSVICTDKTGTLTKGRMSVEAVVSSGLKSFSLAELSRNGQNGPDIKDNLTALRIATICQEAFIENSQASPEEWIVRGRPTDRALLLAGQEAGFNHSELLKDELLLKKIPFDSQRKYIACLHQKEDKAIFYISGAAEIILEKSLHYLQQGTILRLDLARRKQILAKIDELASQGLRVVGVGYRELGQVGKDWAGLKNLVNDFVFVGFIVLNDPLREDAKEAIIKCQKAGIKFVMVTGDHSLTAQEVARKLGLAVKPEQILTGKELADLDDEKLKQIVKQIKIFARVEPQDKMRIIEAWQAQGETVAMTGDGVNDAPALKKADIGVAVGEASDVAKETADLILLNSRFSVIVKAVEQGRVIFDNIRKVVLYLLSDSFTETILVAGSLLAGLPLPVLPVQILWVNLIEDGLPNFALALEPKENDVMKLKPVKRGVSLLNKEMLAIIFIIGLMSDLLLFGLFWWLWRLNHDLSYVRTMVFAGLAINSLVYVFSCKSLRRSLWHINIFSNKYLLGAVAVGAALLLVPIYVGPFQTLLRTVPLSRFDWYVIIMIGIADLALIEFTKWIFISRHRVE